MLHELPLHILIGIQTSSMKEVKKRTSPWNPRTTVFVFHSDGKAVDYASFPSIGAGRRTRTEANDDGLGARVGRLSVVFLHLRTLCDCGWD